MKVYKGKGYFIELRPRQREDGSTHYDILNSQGEPYAYTGSLIKACGGFSGLLEKCVETDKTLKEIEDEYGYQPARSIEQRKVSWQTNKQDIIHLHKQAAYNYAQLMTSDKPNEANTKNVCTILRHCLKRAENEDWGVLPALSIPYSVKTFANTRRGIQNGYYVTLKLAEPIEYHGTMQSCFILGRKNMGMFKNVDFEDGLKPMPADGINPSRT